MRTVTATPDQSGRGNNSSEEVRYTTRILTTKWSPVAYQEDPYFGGGILLHFWLGNTSLSLIFWDTLYYRYSSKAIFYTLLKAGKTELEMLKNIFPKQ